jgi:tritrans,polycis-undecaprenyl-diphosphate synthase [geranylgeranyl-diphosphate specific]
MLESVAFIPDGNRRYAKKSNINLAQSYLKGTQKAWEVIDWMNKYPELKIGTFYTFSLKNFERSKLELKVLMKIFEKELDRVKKQSIFLEKEISIKFIGHNEKFPEKIQKKMLEVEDYTSQFKKKRINLALGYDGQTEIVDAAKRFAEDVQNGLVKTTELTVDSFRKYLYSDFKAPDLIVRTSSEQRLSGFLTYQSSYSELAFVDKYWPELQQSDVDKIFSDYNSRHRRFGR